jgi:hypothetical protein
MLAVYRRRVDSAPGMDDVSDEKNEWFKINLSDVHPAGKYDQQNAEEFRQLQINICRYNIPGLIKANRYELWRNASQLSAMCIGVLFGWQLSQKIASEIKHRDDVDDFWFRPINNDIKVIFCLHAPNRMLSQTYRGIYYVFYSANELHKEICKIRANKKYNNNAYYLVCNKQIDRVNILS